VRALLASVAVLAVAAACGGGKADEETTVVIDTGERRMRVAVEVADTADERARGLMERESLPDDAGMLFTYEDETSGGFGMKNTRIPLSIAFYGEDGEILRLLDMEPCRADPCPVYEPGVPYRGALEVNQGAFERWDVEEGDVIEVEHE
jgi:uncharacterized membrane protein (UPF0127 family)